LRGSFDVAGRATNAVVDPRTETWTVTMAVDLAGAEWLTGTVGRDTWEADLVANRAAFNSRSSPATAFAGKYTMAVPGGTNDDGTVAQGDGYAAVSISTAGAVALSGSVADGTAFRQAASLGLGGEWPIYVSLNGGKDSILGWITNQPGSGLVGTVSWIKTANPAASIYPAGLTNLASVAGWPYIPPTASRIIPLTNGVAIFEGGNLDTPLANLFTLTSANQILDDSVTNKFKLTFTRSSGLVTGSITPSGTRALVIRGAVSQDLGMGFGYFLSTNSSGRFVLGQ